MWLEDYGDALRGRFTNVVLASLPPAMVEVGDKHGAIVPACRVAATVAFFRMHRPWRPAIPYFEWMRLNFHSRPNSSV
jgi:hypothetical protein